VREWQNCRKRLKPEEARNFFSTKMAGAESDIESEGEAVSRPLVRLVLHDKDNETEVGLLAENR
jgi:hypothetical protein